MTACGARRARTLGLLAELLAHHDDGEPSNGRVPVTSS